MQFIKFNYILLFQNTEIIIIRSLTTFIENSNSFVIEFRKDFI